MAEQDGVADAAFGELSGAVDVHAVRHLVGLHEQPAVVLRQDGFDGLDRGRAQADDAAVAVPGVARRCDEYAAGVGRDDEQPAGGVEHGPRLVAAEPVAAVVGEAAVRRAGGRPSFDGAAASQIDGPGRVDADQLRSRREMGRAEVDEPAAAERRIGRAVGRQPHEPVPVRPRPVVRPGRQEGDRRAVGGEPEAVDRERVAFHELRRDDRDGAPVAVRPVGAAVGGVAGDPHAGVGRGTGLGCEDTAGGVDGGVDEVLVAAELLVRLVR